MLYEVLRVAEKIGPMPMTIRTFKPYVGFWNETIRKLEDVVRRPKPVSVELAKPRAKILWIDGLPYATKPII